MSESEPIISVSGLRGIVGRSLTPDVATRYVTAFTQHTQPGPLVLTRDGRATGSMLADTVRGALMAVGRDVLDAGVAATPTTGVLINQLGAAGGIQISASHNPPEYNGLKLFSADGRVISDAAGQPVLKQYRSAAAPAWVAHADLGSSETVNDSTSEHLRRVLATVDVDKIRAQKFHVLLDSNHGAGSLLGQQLLEELGCTVTALGSTPDGQFEHRPEPTAGNLVDVCETVKLSGVAVGFCQDPDADRLALIDESGRFVGEEYTLAIAVEHVLRQTPGPVVTNCSTSRMTEDLANRYGVSFARSKVGEANVTAKMLETGAVFGGEGNGGPIDPRVGFVRDSFVGMALTLDTLAERQEPLSNVAANLPHYAIHKTTAPVDRGAIEATFDRLANHFDDAQADRLDGLRLDWPGRWLLVRASNTEPIVRVIAEAPELDQARTLCEEATSVLQS